MLLKGGGALSESLSELSRIDASLLGTELRVP